MNKTAVEPEVEEQEPEAIEEQEATTEEEEQPAEEVEGEESEPEDEDEELVITVGDEEAPPQEEDEKEEAKPWVKEVRAKNRELAKKNKELERLLKEKETDSTETKPEEIGEKPTLESCDYDEDKFEKELTAYRDRKHEIEKAEAEKRETENRRAEEWKAKVDGYEKAKAKTNIRGYDIAEEAVMENLSGTQQGIILQGASSAEEATRIVAAIGSKPERAKAFSEITDPVEFAFKVGQLSKEIKVALRSAQKPDPEKTIKGSGSIAGSVDSTLEKLRVSAEKSGDYSKVIAYIKKKKGVKNG